MTQPRISIKHLKHRDENQIGLYFQYNSQLISQVKSIEGMRWSQSNKCWYIQNNPDSLRKIFTSLRRHAVIEKDDFFNNKPAHSLSKATSTRGVVQASNEIPGEYLSLLKRRRYSDNTIKIYQHYFYQFINHFPDLRIDQLTEDHIRKFQDYLVNKKKVSISTQNQAINAIKFYFEHVLGGERKSYYVERPRREKKLPDVLTKEEVGLMIQFTTNLKHKCLIAIIYSCGLRRSEALNIKLHHIDTGRKMLKIVSSKGNKDRYLQLPVGVIELITAYITKYRPKEWLFEGQTGGMYTGESILKVIKNSALSVGIKKRVYPHILRHSYATHNLEQGIDIRYIQAWLGHDSIKTTERYTHVASAKHQFKNPIDDLL